MAKHPRDGIDRQYEKRIGRGLIIIEEFIESSASRLRKEREKWGNMD